MKTRKQLNQLNSNKTRKRWNIQPNVVLSFLSKNPSYFPSIENYGDYTIEEDIFRIRLVIWHDGKKRFKTYSDLAKKQNIPNISETILIKLLKDSKQAKYRGRNSPPVSASQLCGSNMKGNDGTMYTSVKNKKGVCTWTKN